MRHQKAIAMIVAIVVGAALVGAGVAFAGAAPTNPTAESLANGGNQPTETITVGTTGQVEAEPDKAVVRLAVEARSDDPGTARTRVGENVSAVKAALDEIGINESAIRTEDFRISEDHRRRPRKPDAEPKTTYRASHRLTVEVDDVDQTGEVIDTAVDSGSAEIHDIQFTLADDTRQELRNGALDNAMANARTQADTIANSADLQIVGVHSVTTEDIRYPRHRVGLEAYAGGDGAGGTELSSGPVSVTASVTVTYNATQ